MEPLCKIRDVYRSLLDFEVRFQKTFQVRLNEGMTLCSLKNSACLTSGQLAEQLGLTYSNMSKVIKSLENKELIERCPGKDDKRQMLFSVTKRGNKVLDDIRNTEIEIPEILQGIL